MFVSGRLGRRCALIAGERARPRRPERAVQVRRPRRHQLPTLVGGETPRTRLQPRAQLPIQEHRHDRVREAGVVARRNDRHTIVDELRQATHIRDDDRPAVPQRIGGGSALGIEVRIR